MKILVKISTGKSWIRIFFGEREHRISVMVKLGSLTINTAMVEQRVLVSIGYLSQLTLRSR